MISLTLPEAAQRLQQAHTLLLLTHRRPDGDTVGSAAALCRGLRSLGKEAAVLENPQLTDKYRPYLQGLTCPSPLPGAMTVSVDVAGREMLCKGAGDLPVDFILDHHGTNPGFAPEGLIDPSAAACGEIIYSILQTLGVCLDRAMAEALYVAVSTDTGCFVYSNVTANTHRVAAALMETGIDYKTANKLHFRTKSKKRLALEGELLRTMEFYDEDRVVIVAVPQSLQKSMALSEADMEDLASLGGLVEGTDCAVTMKETKDGAWKVSVRTGARVNATLVCKKLGGGGHAAAAGATIEGTLEQAKRATLAAIAEVTGE